MFVLVCLGLPLVFLVRSCPPIGFHLSELLGFFDLPCPHSGLQLQDDRRQAPIQIELPVDGAAAAAAMDSEVLGVG